MSKYKATINIERELWDSFRDKCDKLETTASEEIRRFISLFVLEEETKEFDTYDYRQFPNSLKKTYDKLEDKLSISFEQRFERIDKKIEAMRKLFNLGEVWDDYYEFVDYRRLDGEDGRETDNPPAAISQPETDGEIDGRETDNPPAAISQPETDGHETDNPPSEIAANRQLYTDRQVAQSEGLSQYTLSRYRTGKRKPQDLTFWERWELVKDLKKWRRIGG